MKANTKIILLLSLILAVQSLTVYIHLAGKKKVKEDLNELNEDLDRIFTDYYR